MNEQRPYLAPLIHSGERKIKNLSGFFTHGFGEGKDKRREWGGVGGEGLVGGDINGMR